MFRIKDKPSFLPFGLFDFYFDYENTLILNVTTGAWGRVPADMGTWLILQGTSGYSSLSTWQKAKELAAPMVRKPVPGISSFSPAPPVAQKQMWNTLTSGSLGSRKTWNMKHLWWKCRWSFRRLAPTGRRPSRTRRCWRGASPSPAGEITAQIWNKRHTRPHKRSEPRAPTQWRSFRDWVCGGPSCHQLKPREETTSVTFPTAFSRACLTSVAPSSDPAATTGGFQEDARAWEANQLSDVSEPLLCYRGTVHPIFNKRWPGFSRNDITGFTMWLFLHHKLFNKTLVWPESVGVQQYVWRCDKWSTNWLKKRV